MTHRNAWRLAAATAALALVGFAGAPADAAMPQQDQKAAQASKGKVLNGVKGTASAVDLNLAGQQTGSGQYTATNFGKGEETTGNNKPLLKVLGGQQLIKQGTLNQDASATKALKASACAGLAGNGASLAAVGDSSCLTPGQNISITPVNLDLSKVQILPADITGGQDAQVLQLLGPLLGPLQTGLQQALTATGVSVSANLRAVQGFCTSTTDSASGRSELTGVDLTATVGGQTLNLLNLPAAPAPNTPINLGTISDAVAGAVAAELSTAIQGQLAQLGVLATQAQQQIKTNLLTKIDTNLAPLDQLISGTLNAQTRRGKNFIDVQALRLVIGKGGAALGQQPITLGVGHVTCGPAQRTLPGQVPNKVNSGLGQAQAGNGDDVYPWVGLAGAGLLVAAGVGVAYRRRALQS